MTRKTHGQVEGVVELVEAAVAVGLGRELRRARRLGLECSWNPCMKPRKERTRKEAIEGRWGCLSKSSCQAVQRL